MKKILYFLLIIAAAQTNFAQTKITQTNSSEVNFAQTNIPPKRFCNFLDYGSFEIEMPNTTTINGYYGHPNVLLPGYTLTQKANNFVEALKEKYGATLFGKDFQLVTIRDNGSSMLYIYQQHVAGVPIHFKRISLVLANNGRLLSFQVDVLDDQTIITELEEEIDALPPGDYIIREINGNYTVVGAGVAAIVDCGNDGGDPVTIDFTIPVHSCCDVPSQESISSAGNGFLSSKMSGKDLCGKYANQTAIELWEGGQPDLTLYECNTLTERARFTTVMCYYHLNRAFQYIDDSYNGGNQEITANSASGIEFFASGQNASKRVIVDVGAESIAFTHTFSDDAGSCSSRIDYSEDADWIVGATFEWMIHQSFVFPLVDVGAQTGVEGLPAGMIGFLTYQYNVLQDGNSNQQIGAFGVQLEPGNFPVNVGSSLNYGDLTQDPSPRLNGSIWASTLKDIYDVLDAGHKNLVMDYLTTDNMTMWTGTTDQFQAAVMFHNTCKNLNLSTVEPMISSQELCEIELILREKYEDFDPDTNDEYFFEWSSDAPDFYVKDTYQDQEIWNGDPNDEDIGDEPNTQSTHLWISPSIYNCEGNSFCDEYQRPKYNGPNGFNYFYIKVDNRGCWTDMEGKLKVYVSIAATGHRWPQHWVGTPGGVMNENLPYELFWNGGASSGVAGKMAGFVELDDASNYVIDGDQRIYKIPWIPLNPLEFETHPDIDIGSDQTLHVCVLARIESDDDPMFDEQQDVGIGYNIRKNNNVAMRNYTIEYESGGFAGGPSTEYSSHLILRRNSTGLTTTIASNEMNLGLSVVRTKVMPNQRDFWNAGELKYRLPSYLWRQLKSAQPNGWKLLAKNEVAILNQETRLPLRLNENVDNIIRVIFTPSRSFVPVHFHITQHDDNDCIEGGQEFLYGVGYTPPIVSRKQKSDEDETLFLMPNPTRDYLEVLQRDQKRIVAIQLFNMQGNQLSESFKPIQNKVDVSHMVSGAYIMRIEMEDGSKIIKRFIKL